MTEPAETTVLRTEGVAQMNCGIYKHYKGEFYLLLGEAEHTETNERLAIYVSLDASQPGPRLRARPLHEFVGLVELNVHDVADRVPRFEFVGDRPKELRDAG